MQKPYVVVNGRKLVSPVAVPQRLPFCDRSPDVALTGAPHAHALVDLIACPAMAAIARASDGRCAGSQMRVRQPRIPWSASSPGVRAPRECVVPHSAGLGGTHR